MGIERFFVRPVTILHPVPVTDSYNNDLDDWDSASSTALKGWLSQTAAQEVLGNRDAQIVDAVLFLPADTNIAEHDRVVVDGNTYEVTGLPNKAPTPRGIHHIECALTAVSG